MRNEISICENEILCDATPTWILKVARNTLVSNVVHASTQEYDIVIFVVCVNEENNSGERIIQLLCFLFQLWNELCEMISKNPDKVTSLKVYAIIQQGIKRYTDQVGQLWKSLADYYVRSGHFEKVSIAIYSKIGDKSQAYF